MQAVLRDDFLHGNIIGKQWNSPIGLYTGRYQDIKMKWSCSFFSRFLKPDTGDSQRNPPTLLTRWHVEPQSGQPCYYPKAGTQRVLGAQIQQDHQGSRLLAKEARDRPQKVCERLLMFTNVFSVHQACSYTAAIWLWIPCSGLQSSRSAVRIHWNEESLVHWQF